MTPTASIPITVAKVFAFALDSPTSGSAFVIGVMAAEDHDGMEANRIAVDGPVLGGGKCVRGFRG